MLDQDGFAGKMTKAIRKLGYAKEITYDREQFCLTTPNGTFNLGNAYGYYTRAGFFQRARVIREHAQSFSAMAENATPFPKTFDEARASLIPMVRGAVYVADIDDRMRSGGTGPFAFFERISDRIFVLPGLDTQRNIGVISAKTAEEWGVSLEDLMKAARFNLRMRNPTPFVELQPGFFVASTGDYHDAGRLLLTEIISRLPLNGSPIAFVPNPGVVFVTGSNDPQGHERLAHEADEQLMAPKQISSELLRLEGERWVAYTPPATMPGTAKLRELDLRCLAGDYEASKKALQTRVGDAWFVASHQILGKEGEPSFSNTLWSEGVVTLLPRADTVMFLSAAMQAKPDSIQPNFVPWSKMVEVIGTLSEEPGTFPTRYRAATFPTATQLAQMGIGAS
jgi:hypothetical protein